MIWLATLRRRIICQAFRDQFPPVKEVTVTYLESKKTTVIILAGRKDNPSVHFTLKEVTEWNNQSREMIFLSHLCQSSAAFEGGHLYTPYKYPSEFEEQLPVSGYQHFSCFHRKNATELFGELYLCEQSTVRLTEGSVRGSCCPCDNTIF